MHSLIIFLLTANAALAADPLPSWNETAPKKAIVAFVEKVAQPGSPDFVPASARIATFDNDGTLWAEQPMYFQACFVFERIKALSAQHPEWKDKEPFVGRRPIFAFGNSDGDLQMLQWTAAGSGARFMGIVHHTDAEREWAYDRESSIGRLDKALDEAKAKGWTVVSIKDDWKTVFPK